MTIVQHNCSNNIIDLGDTTIEISNQTTTMDTIGKNMSNSNNLNNNILMSISSGSSISRIGSRHNSNNGIIGGVVVAVAGARVLASVPPAMFGTPPVFGSLPRGTGSSRLASNIMSSFTNFYGLALREEVFGRTRPWAGMPGGCNSSNGNTVYLIASPEFQNTAPTTMSNQRIAPPTTSNQHMLISLA